MSVNVDPYLTFYATIRIEPGMQLSNAGIRLKFQYYSGGWYDVGWICYDDNQNPGWSYVTPSGSGSCYTYAISSYGNTWIGVDDGVAPGRSVYNDFNTAYPGYLGNYQVRVSLVECYDYAHGNIFAGQTTYAKFDGIRLGDYPPTPSVSISPTTTEYDTSGTTVTYQWSFGDVPNLLCRNGYQLWLRDGIKYQFNAYVDGVLLVSYGDVTESSSWKDYPVTMSAKGEYTAYITARVLIDPHAPWINNTYFSKVLNGYTLTVNTHWLASATGTTTLTYVQHGTTKYAYPKDTDTSKTVIVDPSSTASVPTDVSYSAGNYRVHTYDTRSWTISSTCTKDINYYKQYWSSIATSGLISSYPATISVVQGGTTNNPTTYGTWSDWADYNSKLRINSTVNVSGTRRYHTPNTVSWMVDSYPFSKSVTYYCQWKPNIILDGTDSLHTVTATYTLDDSSTSSANLYSSWSNWVDHGAALTFSSETTGGTSTERWHTYDPRSFTVTSAQTATIAYVHQYYVSLDPRDWQDNPLGRTVNAEYTGDSGGGAHGTYKPSITSTSSYWMDANLILNISKLTSGSTLQELWYCYNGTLNGDWRTLGAVTQSKTHRLVFFHQFRPELQLLSSQYGGKIYDDYNHVSVGDWVYASAWLWDSDVDARPTEVGTFNFKWIAPNGQIVHQDNLMSSNCYTDSFQVPQTYGEWKLQITWSDDGATTVYNATVSFSAYGYDFGAKAEDTGSGNVSLDLNVTFKGDPTISPYNVLIAVTTGGATASYLRNLNLIYGTGGRVMATMLSTSFFTTGSGVTWTAHIVDLDPLSAHYVAFVVSVYDPVTGYVYMNRSSSKALLNVGGGEDMTITFTPSESWWRNGLLRVRYTFLVYDSIGGNQETSPLQDFGDSDPISWLMRGTGAGDVRAVYFLTGLSNSSILERVPASLLASSGTASFYFAFEDCYTLSTQSQINPIMMHYVNITYMGSNVFATGCVPPSKWLTEGTNTTLNIESPFYPKPPYYSDTTRFIFLGWRWTYTRYPHWVSSNDTTITIEVAQPIQVVAYWRTQFLVEFTPYVPTTAPTDTVQVSYTANKTLVNKDVKSAETIRVWVDANTLFTMHELWVNDYTWYRAHYDTPYENVTGGTSLTLDYVRTTNTVTNLNAQSNNFEAGGTLSLNLTLTTTYFNAQWVNVTVMVASKNAILVDANGLTWSNVKIQLQNNTAQITIPLPQDIGNGTLTVTLTPYGKVEPTTKQIVLASSAIPPQGGGTNGGTGANFGPAIAITGIAFTAVLAASVSIRAVTRRRRRERDSRTEAEAETREGEAPASGAPTASMVMRRGSRVAELQLLSLVKAVALMELDVEKGVQLRVLQDGDSRFIRFLKRDTTRCGDYFDTAAKSYPGTLSITKWGDHITFVPYSKRGGRGRGRHMKSILIISTLRELRNSEVEELKRNMVTKPQGTNEKFAAATDSTPKTQRTTS
nr:hypothetical protein [Candidatus Njordarchaeota archaeon]